MKNYPQIGDTVRIKETGETRIVAALWKPGRVVLEEGKGSGNPIMYLAGIELVPQPTTKEREG